MNDKQKWFIVVAVGCISALGMALIFRSDIYTVFDIDVYGSYGETRTTNWTGCVLFGILPHPFISVL